MRSFVFLFVSIPAFASSPVSGSENELQTQPGSEFSLSISDYSNVEPNVNGVGGDARFEGTKIGVEYSHVFPLDDRRKLFAIAELRGLTGNVVYTSPTRTNILVPDPTHPSGTNVIRAPGPDVQRSGVKDWYVEGRALIGKDIIKGAWLFSPYVGVGFRHLSNGNGNREQDYLFLPLGITAQTSELLKRKIEFNLEADVLLRGWQLTQFSYLPPSGTFLSATDVKFTQRLGGALRTSAKINLDRRWSVEPYFVHWSIDTSSVDFSTVRYTLAGQPTQVSAALVEPYNFTNEFGVKLGFRF
jgi:hypothetical protein